MEEDLKTDDGVAGLTVRLVSRWDRSVGVVDLVEAQRRYWRLCAIAARHDALIERLQARWTEQDDSHMAEATPIFAQRMDGHVIQAQQDGHGPETDRGSGSLEQPLRIKRVPELPYTSQAQERLQNTPEPSAIQRGPVKIVRKIPRTDHAAPRQRIEPVRAGSEAFVKPDQTPVHAQLVVKRTNATSPATEAQQPNRPDERSAPEPIRTFPIHVTPPEPVAELPELAALPSVAKAQRPRSSTPKHVLETRSESIQSASETLELARGCIQEPMPQLIWRKPERTIAQVNEARAESLASADRQTAAHSKSGPVRSSRRQSSAAPTLTQAHREINLHQLADNVSRLILRKLSMDVERHGGRPWR
jgi:hypothetical protein